MQYQLTIFRCKWCDELLASSGKNRKMRADKLFCNASCRAKYSNWRARAFVLSASIGKQLHELGVYLDRADTREDGMQAFAIVLKDFREETLKRGVEVKPVK